MQIILLWLTMVIIENGVHSIYSLTKIWKYLRLWVLSNLFVRNAVNYLKEMEIVYDLKFYCNMLITENLERNIYNFFFQGYIKVLFFKCKMSTILCKCMNIQTDKLVTISYLERKIEYSRYSTCIKFCMLRLFV